MPKPLIGLTTSRYVNKRGQPRIMVPEAYVQAVTQTGAVPLLVPLGLPEEVLQEMTYRLDGILFTGGGDVEPWRYGSVEHPNLGKMDSDRDRVELALFQNILEQKKPFFGICRGLQLINVALGGTLFADIGDQLPGAIPHQYSHGWPRHHLAHPVTISQGSQLEQILGQVETRVNSLHHQGVDRLAHGVQATAHAPDGLVEAFELPGYPFGLAVQWHPECLQAHEPMRNLFRAFAQAANH